MSFEGLSLPVPKDYDELLRKRYGPDYMIAKNDDDRKHAGKRVCFDPKRPYTQTMKTIKESDFF